MAAQERKFKIHAEMDEDGKILRVVAGGTAPRGSGWVDITDDPRSREIWNRPRDWYANPRSKEILEKVAVDIRLDKTIFKADGRDKLTVLFDDIPLELDAIDIDVNGQRVRVLRGEPLEITADTEQLLRIRVLTSQLRSKVVTALAQKTLSLSDAPVEEEGDGSVGP